MVGLKADFDIFYRLSYKYRLLYCLMINYYRNYYSDNKFTGKILVLCTNRKETMHCYEKMYSTVRSFKEKDIFTLKKFLTFYDVQLKELYDVLDRKHIGYKKIINDIKAEYTPNKSAYINSKRNSLINILSDKNVLFMEFSNSKNIYEKHLIKEIFIPERYELDYDKYPVGEMCSTIEIYIREVKKVKEVLNSTATPEPEFINLNVFLNTSDGLDICDAILADLKDDY